MKLNRAIFAAAACVLAAGLTACTFSTPATALTVDGEDIPAGIYLCYQLQNYNAASSALTYEGKAIKLDAEYEGTTLKQYVLDKTAVDMGRYVWLNREFEAQGLSFTEEEQTQMEGYVQQAYAQMKEALSDNGIGEESYLAYYAAEVKYSRLYSAYAKAEQDGVTNDDVKAHLDENYVRARQLSLPVTNDDNKRADEDKLAIVDGYLQSALTDLQNGKDFDEVAQTYIQKACETVGRTYSDDLLDTYSTKVFYSVEERSSDTDLIKAIRAADVGDTGSAMSYSSTVVYQRISNYESEEDLEENRSNAVSEILSRRFDQKIEEAAAAMNIDASQAQKNFPISKVK